MMKPGLVSSRLWKAQYSRFSVISISDFEGSPDMHSASGSERAVMLSWAYAWPAPGCTGRQEISLLKTIGLICLQGTFLNTDRHF